MASHLARGDLQGAGHDSDLYTGSPPGKRRKVEAQHTTHKAPVKRIAACISCRLKKVKCDKGRPRCIVCVAGSTDCRYQEDEKITLDSATRTVLARIDVLDDQIQKLNQQVAQLNTPQQDSVSDIETTSNVILTDPTGPSRDFSQIPACRTSADAVLDWEIYDGAYPTSALIGPLFHPGAEGGTPSMHHANPDDERLQSGQSSTIDVKSIPVLIDSFLQNVHTKNPILDVESLIRSGREISKSSIGWDGWSCLVLLACALGSIAKPFDQAAPFANDLSLAGRQLVNASSSAVLFRDELQLAERFFIEASRRTGLLKHTVVAAQCHFYSGVYLMYTLRPLPSWQSFYQASIVYQLYLKVNYGVTDRSTDTFNVPSSALYALDKRNRRLEESLFWSCFKSECEFRVELPLPQSEMASLEYPNLFPSPPSPVAAEMEDGGRSQNLPGAQSSLSVSHLIHQPVAVQNTEFREHAKRLCNEEESWYYYLTEIALRRIGNRIINSFFRQPPKSWVNIKPLLRIAVEFDAQVSSWSAHLPTAMKHWETTSSIRAPSFDSVENSKVNFVSRELSWATDNRLLEMRSWLYQPFLYYLIHHHNHLHPGKSRDSSLSGSCRTSNNFPNTTADSASMETAHPDYLDLTLEEVTILEQLIASGIECNMKILDVRSLRHRHHGLWYDLRSMSCAALILLSIVKAGHIDRIPGGIEALWIRKPDMQSALSARSEGRINSMLRQFRFWSDECPHLRHDVILLEGLSRDILNV